MLEQKSHPKKIVVLGCNGYVGKAMSSLMSSQLSIPIENICFQDMHKKLKDNSVDYTEAVGIICTGAKKLQTKGSNYRNKLRNIEQDLYEAMTKKMSRLVYLSTADVYKRALVTTEKSTLDENSEYAESRLLSERNLLGSSSKVLILRSQTIWGSSFDQTSYVSNLITSLTQDQIQIKKQFKSNFVRTPIHIQELTNIVEHWIYEPFYGVFNVSGRVISLSQLIRIAGNSGWRHYKITKDIKILSSKKLVNQIGLSFRISTKTQLLNEIEKRINQLP